MPDGLQGTIFDAIAARELAVAGLERASNGREAVLELARRGAREIALGRVDRTCHMDLVNQWLVDRGIDEQSLGNAAGSVFRGKHWYWDEISVVKSLRPASHGRLLRVWKLLAVSSEQ